MKTGDDESIAGETHYSGVLIVTVPAKTEACAADLADRLGVEVGHRDPAGGRMIAVLESGSITGLERRLREIRALGDVLLAQPVSHYVDRSDGGETP